MMTDGISNQERERSQVHCSFLCFCAFTSAQDLTFQKAKSKILSREKKGSICSYIMRLINYSNSYYVIYLVLSKLWLRFIARCYYARIGNCLNIEHWPRWRLKFTHRFDCHHSIIALRFYP